MLLQILPSHNFLTIVLALLGETQLDSASMVMVSFK